MRFRDDVRSAHLALLTSLKWKRHGQQNDIKYKIYNETQSKPVTPLIFSWYLTTWSQQIDIVLLCCQHLY